MPNDLNELYVNVKQKIVKSIQKSLFTNKRSVLKNAQKYIEEALW